MKLRGVGTAQRGGPRWPRRRELKRNISFSFVQGVKMTTGLEMTCRDGIKSVRETDRGAECVDIVSASAAQMLVKHNLLMLHICTLVCTLVYRFAHWMTFIL